MHDWLRAHDLAGEQRSIQDDFTVRLRRSGSFVSQIHYDGDDLVLTLTTPKVMARWKDGSHIVGQVSAYLQGIRQGRYRATRNLAGERRHVQG